MRAFAIAAMLYSLGVFAQPVYPSKPVKLIVAGPVGTAPDVIGRMLVQKMAEGLGQTIVVENRPGAGGTIGTAAAAAAPADGYTLYLATTGHLAAGPVLFPRAGIDAVGAFDAISRICTAPIIVVVPAALRVVDVKGLVAYSRERAGKLNYGSLGNGSAQHILMEWFKAASGADLVHVPYRSIADIHAAIASGDVSAVIEQPINARERERAGKIRVLAIAAPVRHPDFPAVPTMAEAGVAGFDPTVWIGLAAPRGTPAAIIARLNAETHKALADKGLHERLLAMGNDPAPTTPEAFGAFIAREVEVWRRVVRASGAAVD